MPAFPHISARGALCVAILLTSCAHVLGLKVIPGSGAINQTGSPLNDFACRFGYVNEYFASNYVAVPSRLFADAGACGQCMTIKCNDASCKALPAVTAVIVDQCYECTASTVKLSTPAYSFLSGTTSGSVSASYVIGDCGDLATGNIYMWSQDSTNLWWQALTFSNSKKGLAAVSLNGIALVQESWGAWTWTAKGTPLGSSNSLVLRATDGQIITATLSNMKTQSLSALTDSMFFYAAQKSGQLPSDNPVAWRGNSHLDDFVPGGYYDAGDFLKLNFPLGTSMTFIAWGLLEFPSGYEAAGLTATARDRLKWGVDYIAACHYKSGSYVGQIGDPGVDHSYWGRAEQEPGSRPYYVWNGTMAMADLASSAASALASASIVFSTVNATYAASLLSHAVALHKMAAANEGLYSSSYTSVTYVYSSSTYLDDLAFSSAWLYRATQDTTYLTAAQTYLQRAQYSRNYYVNWDGVFPAADVLLKSMGVANSAGVDLDYQIATFRSTWQQGQNGVTYTPGGLSIPPFGGWGNLRHALNAAFVCTIHAKITNDSSQAAADLKYAKSQLDYALGSTGRSFVVGFGTNPPTHEHHRGASCPDLPASCGWDQFYASSSNPQVLYGGLVGGPAATESDYSDVRDNYQSNEVAVDYNAGFTGTMAGLIQLL